jgi:hypothetical protein
MEALNLGTLQRSNPKASFPASNAATKEPLNALGKRAIAAHSNSKGNCFDHLRF